MKLMKFRNIYFSFFPFFLRNVILLKTLLNNSNKFLFLKIQIKKNFEIRFVNNCLFVNKKKLIFIVLLFITLLELIENSQ